MDISFARPARPASGAWVVGVMDGGVLSSTATQVDSTLGGAIKRV